ncbi:MAG: hypothetical protein Q9209_007768 [Squamulea sp. 1 TL-2023]
MSPSPLHHRTSNDHDAQRSSESGSVDPLAAAPLMPANKKATEWKPTYMSDDAYEADHELDGSYSDMTAAERTANFINSKTDDPTALNNQYQSIRSQLTLWPKHKYPPYEMFGDYMDESCFKSDLDYSDYSNLNGIAGADVPPSLSDNESSYDADYSSDSSYNHSSKPSIQHEEPQSPRLHDTAPDPTMVYRVRSDVHEDHSIYALGPFSPAHWERLSDLDPAATASRFPSTISLSEPITQWHKGLPDYSPTFQEIEIRNLDWYGEAAVVNRVYEPVTNMSLYEQLTGSCRTSSTVEEREKDELAVFKPSGVTWTHFYGPFDQSSTSSESTSPPLQGLGPSDGHASRVEAADGISRIPVIEPVSSLMLANSSSWISVVPHCENLRASVGRKGGDWDFSVVVPIFGDLVGNVSIGKRYRVGMKGFLRLN